MPLTTAIVTQQIVSVLKSDWQPYNNWWVKNTDTHELYLIYLSAVSEHPGMAIVTCSTCAIDFPISSRARKNQCNCIFGCREKNKKEKNRKNKKLQRQRDRHNAVIIDTFPSQAKNIAEENVSSLAINIDSLAINTPSLLENIQSLKITELTASVALLVLANHPHLKKIAAKLYGIIAFMSVGMKFADQIPDWLVDVSEDALMEVINGIADG